jgi:hypothetical protein
LADWARAFDDFEAYHLGHDLGILGVLVAGTAVGLSTPLAVLNTKDYRVVANAQILQPYEREQ